VGTPIDLAEATPGWDLVVLKRGGPGQPGKTNTSAQGHVGWFAGRWVTGNHDNVLVLGGNQGNAVTVGKYPAERILDVRRLAA